MSDPEHHGYGDHPLGGRGPDRSADTVIDPVCGMAVDPAKTPHHAQHGAETFHFCSAGCRAKFVSEPAKYLKTERATPPAAPASAIYTCPMHPQVRRVGPGSCPICGMALEPELATAGDGPNPELADMTWRFWVGLTLALPVFVLEMGGHLIDLHHWIAPQISNWVQLALATPVALWAGWPFFEPCRLPPCR